MLGVACHRRDFERQFQGHVAVVMNAGRDVDVDANVNILKLCINERINADAADTGLERSRGHRDAVADLERGLLVVEGANLRVLDDLGVAVAQQRGKRRRRDADLKIVGIQVRELVERDAAVAGGPSGPGGSGVVLRVRGRCRRVRLKLNTDRSRRRQGRGCGPCRA